MSQSSHPQYDVLRRQGLWGVFKVEPSSMGLVPLEKTTELISCLSQDQERIGSLSVMCVYNKRLEISNQDSPHQNLTMLLP